MQIHNIDKELFLTKKGIINCYHYTSVDALISILKNNSLRFTHCEFLNDIEEYNYIFDLLEEEEMKNDESYELKGVLMQLEKTIEILYTRFLIPIKTFTILEEETIMFLVHQ